MEWSIFITSVFVLYGLWYAGNLVKDTVFSRRPSREGESVSYDMESFPSEDKPTEVKGPMAAFSAPPGITLPKGSGDSSFKKPPEEQAVSSMEQVKAGEKAEISASKIRLS